MYKKFFKRAIDVVLSFIGIVVLSPVYLTTVVFIKAESRGPVIFKQDRLGKNGVVYKSFP